jgi:hypothetical protein
VGFVAQLSKGASRAVVADALKMLARMSHRGACGCEENTGKHTWPRWSTSPPPPQGVVVVGVWWWWWGCGRERGGGEHSDLLLPERTIHPANREGEC